MGHGGQPSSLGDSATPAGVALGPLEARILAILWRQTSATVPEIVTAVHQSGHQVAYTTVLTVVSRLHARGLLTREREGRSHRYRPAISEAELVSRASDAAVAGVLDRFGQTALRQFALRLADLDPETRRELIALAGATPPAVASDEVDR